MLRFTFSVAFFAGVALLASCDKKRAPSGLAPAGQWQTAQGSGGAALPPPGPAPSMGGAGAPSDPHAGVNMNDPHAGVDMGGGSPDVTKLGLEAPDPRRAIDPTKAISGVIEVHPKAAARTKPGTAVFIVAKTAGADGAPTGAPLAVDKLEWTGAPLPFTLSEANAMVKGTSFAGDVIITVRYDQDSDAMTKEPGDITGQLQTKVPGQGVKILLDTVLP